ncbi:MAG: hypothetical protein ACREMX_10420, partial [Gemmatimonadales bacterium]
MTREELEREEPEIVDVEPVGARRWPRWLFVLGTLLIVGGAAWVVLSRILQPPALVEVSEATDVRSDITQQGDSLDVVVDWGLTSAPAQGVAESVRVEVGLDSVNVTEVSTLPAELRTDTLRIPAPQLGESASGYSCVATIIRGRLTRETCTPWQFVRPAAGQGASMGTDSTERRTARGGTTGAARIRQVVVQPSGFQVDPDVGGRCADWQRKNPGKSVWLDVNFRAVAECTGPNGKPTVAQFCAFAVMEDGQRVK